MPYLTNFQYSRSWSQRALFPTATIHVHCVRNQCDVKGFSHTNLATVAEQKWNQQSVMCRSQELSNVVKMRHNFQRHNSIILKHISCYIFLCLSCDFTYDLDNCAVLLSPLTLLWTQLHTCAHAFESRIRSETICHFHTTEYDHPSSWMWLSIILLFFTIIWTIYTASVVNIWAVLVS